MEEEANQQVEEKVEETQVETKPVYAPAPPGSSSGKKGKKTAGVVLLVIALILILGGTFYFLGQKRKNAEEAEATPESNLYVVSEVPETPSTPEAEEVVDKKTISIQILNGTGIVGEASYLKEKLQLLGYEDIEAANADSQDYTATSVSFASSLSKSVVNEITDELEKVYEEVSISKTAPSGDDILIITGLRKGATAKPQATATPQATSTPTSSPSPSPTATSL